jgi:hypothetical protein
MSLDHGDLADDRTHQLDSPGGAATVQDRQRSSAAVRAFNRRTGRRSGSEYQVGKLRGQMNSPKGPWIYVTHGAWEAAAAHHVFEFFVLSPQLLDDANVELLAMLTFSTQIHDRHWMLVVSLILGGRLCADRSWITC